MERIATRADFKDLVKQNALHVLVDDVLLTLHGPKSACVVFHS